MICGHLGSFNTATTRTHVGFQFSTHAAAGGNVAPNSAFEAADIRIYRATDGAAFSATQRSSANGITMTSPFDSLTGVHDVDIDLTDNTDAGFYAAGNRYTVILAPDETVDGQTITGVVLAAFDIGVPAVNVTQFGGTAGTFASGRPEVNASHIGGSAISQASGVANVNVAQISGDSTAADNLESAFDDTVGANRWTGIIDQGTAQAATGTTLRLRSAAAFADDELNGCWVVITGGTTGVGQVRQITDYVSSTDTATVDTWTTTPTGTITYQVLPGAMLDANVTKFGGTAATTSGGRPEVNTTLIEGTDATNQIRDSVVDDATRIDASALNTLSGHDPGETIMGATDLGTGAGLTTLATQASVNTIDGIVDDILVDTAEIGAAGAGLTNINLPNQTMDIVGNITGNLSGSVGSVTGSVGSVAANGLSASSLAADAVDEILDEQIGDGTITLRQALRILVAGMAGKLSGAATTTVTIRNLADSADVVVATVDADGNRSAVTVTP